MPVATEIIRGNVIAFSTTFYDADGAPITPVSVNLEIEVVSPPNGAKQEFVIAMTNVSTLWSANWDTTGVPSGIVYWAVKANGPHGADQGRFNLNANLANI